MKSVRSMLGMPVVLNGRRIGRVSGVQLSKQLSQVRGVWVDRGFKPRRYLDEDGIELIGDVSLLAKSAGRREKGEGKTIFTRALAEDGSRAGAITDAYVDPETGEVLALELSRGVWDDLIRGRSRVSHYTVRPDGEVVVTETM